MKKFHTGGPVKGTRIQDGEVPIIASNGVGFVGPTRTGRWSGKCPARSQEPRTIIIDTDDNRAGRAAAIARMVSMDYSQIERRVMAQMAGATGVSDKVLRHGMSRPPFDATVEMWRRVFDLMLVRMMDKELAYLFAYSGFDAVQTRIDEEGCGAVFAAAKEWPDADD